MANEPKVIYNGMSPEMVEKRLIELGLFDKVKGLFGKKSKPKTDPEFEKLHPRSEDGRFTDKIGKGGLLPTVKEVEKAAEDIAIDNATYKLWEKNWKEWDKNKSEFIEKEEKKRQEKVADLHDQADNHSKLILKIEKQMRAAKVKGDKKKYSSLKKKATSERTKMNDFRARAEIESQRDIPAFTEKEPVRPSLKDVLK